MAAQDRHNILRVVIAEPSAVDFMQFQIFVILSCKEVTQQLKNGKEIYFVRGFILKLLMLEKSY